MKKLGQHFLIDNETAKKEVRYADINKNDVVLEIGPGKGVLTKILAGKAHTVIAVEIDKKLASHLKNILPDNVEIINDDVLNLDFKKIPVFNKIVSNIPFQISSPLTFKLLKTSFEKAVIIYQKEFAERMVASPGDKNYSRLTVNIYYKAKCEILDIIPKKCFHPQPQVDACIVKIVPRTSPPFDVKDENFFHDLTKKLFMHRRKKIKNTIKKYYGLKKLDDIPFINNRVEDLKPEEIGELSSFILKQHHRF